MIVRMTTTTMMVMFGVFGSVPALGLVDMKNANFANTWTDLIVPGSGYDLRLQRTYSSRSLVNGLTGFGMCTDFETKLDVMAEGNLKITECGGGLEIIYTASDYKLNKVKETIDTIITEVKKRNRDLKPEYFKNLEKELTENAVLRDEFTKQLNLKGNVVSGKVYMANGREVENVVLSKGKYKRTLEDGTFQVFDSDGFLESIYDRNGNFLKLSWKSNLLLSVVDNNGRRLSFSYNSAKKLSSITGPNGLSAKYKFSGEDLVEVVNAWKNKFKYSYDNLHNLTRIDYPDRTYKAITYNSDKDWVMSFRNRRGCVETYTYDVDKQDPKDHYSSSVKKVCNKKVTNQSSYEFFHKDRGDGLGKYLYRVKSDNNGEISDVIYHEIFGKPISVINNKFKTSYTYYDNGLVKTKTEPLRSLFFKYDNKCKKVSEVDIRLFIPEGEGAESEDRKVSNIKKSKVSKREKPKLAKKVTSQFRYDSPKCNLVFAKNSDGQIAKMKYDSRGRISLIEDQSKKIVKVEYEERFGKPARVERPGLGTIKVTYKPSGEIDKVQSKDGPNVAVQVASIFNTLLEIIAPATTEASI